MNYKYLSHQSSQNRFALLTQLVVATTKLFFLVVAFVFVIPDLRAQTELIANDKFDDEGASWSLIKDERVESTMSIVKVEADPTLFLDVAVKKGSLGSNPEDKAKTRLQKTLGQVDVDKMYRVSFKAKCGENATIISYICPAEQPSLVLWRTLLKLDVDWKEFVFNFKVREQGENCVLGFAGLGDSTNKFWFKDVVVTVD